ncbi:putative acetyltransferase [Monaibacterium marinum]|uniref:Putative acetyltransferase n=2 Tax=Pontivivens marinum TaxID=1690039 RepID=A0A2C9CT67_9RHOB|nr:putative acetyltransferase [Monaibacterium marinum]
MRDGDISGIAQVFYEAVSHGAAAHYTAAQRRAWGGDTPNPNRWAERLIPLDVLVAQDDCGRITGFFSVRLSDGLVDHMFVLPSRQGTGLGERLLERVEDMARLEGLPRLWTEASLLARPFLERHDWYVVTTQDVAVRGQVLRNFVMHRVLS